MRRYDLALQFVLGSLDYQGRVTLRDERLGPEVELDAEGLEVLSVDAGGRPVPYTADRAKNTLRIEGIPEGTGEVTIAFTGRVEAERPIGIYQSPLGDGTLITTDLEPTAARRVFPCLDRPDAKAVISLEVVAPPDAVPISNMPAEASETLPDGRCCTRFAPTPAMSTYLFYLGVGPFEQREHVYRGFRVIGATARGSSEKTAFLLEESGRLLEYYSNYYGSRYPLPKLHLLAIPRFFSGAMENWGAITCSEAYALADDRTSMLLRQGMFTMQAHEIAHQWFGNLVTMRKWDDLWLNESFATFASFKARHELHPEWAAWEEFLSEQVSDAMVYDSLRSTHPIHVTVTDDRRAPEFFDEISYGKGAAVLRMLEAYVGEQAFREGVSLYLREHEGGSADAADLWKAIAHASREPIDRVMPDWVLRPGYPLLRARREGDSIVLEQDRFGLTKTREEPPWPVPLSLGLPDAVHRKLMTERTLRLPVPPGVPVVIGPGRVGFFRTRYEGELWELVLRSYPRMRPEDRWGLLDDARAFLLSGEMELPEYLRVLDHAALDTSALVANQACDALSWLAPLTLDVLALRDAFRRVIVAQCERLGLASRTGEPPADAVARERVVQARVSLDAAFARRLANEYPRVDRTAPELEEATYMAFAANAGPTEYTELRRRFREAPPGLAARAVAGGFGCLPRDEWILECLGLVATGEMQLAAWMHLLNIVFWRNPGHYSALWSFLTDRLEACLPALSTGGSTTAYLLQCAIPCVGLGRPEAMKQWVADHPLPGTEEARKKGLDVLEALVSIMGRIRGMGEPARGPAKNTLG
jgi:tricorn protease interacting factor F2/3